MVKASEFYQEHQQDGKLPPEAMTDLLLSGDIYDFSLEEGDEQAEIKEEEVAEKEEAAEEASPEEASPEEEEKPVIEGKHGNHTIEYEKLEQAREAENAAKESEKQAMERVQELELSNKELMDKLSALEDAKQTADDEGDTEGYDKLADEIKEDYPEIVEYFEKREESLVAKIKADHQQEIDSLRKDIEPAKRLSEETRDREHFEKVYEVHEDLDAVLAGSELIEWIESQPRSIILAYADILESGSPAEVNNMLSTFKKATDWKAPEQEKKAKPEVKGKTVEDKIKENEEAVPKSLSDIPGASLPVDEAQAMMNMDSMKLMDKFGNMTPAQIEQHMSRLV